MTSAALSWWTPERIERLRALHTEGRLSCSQMATELHAPSRSSVIGKLHRLGLTGKDRPAAKADAPVKRSPRARMRVSLAPAVHPAIEPDAPYEADVINLHERISLLDARKGQCRWPAADDGSAAMVCGAPVSGGSWCPRHCRVAYRGV